MTEHEALQITIDMWSWLEKQPDQTKLDWISLFPGRFDHWTHNCPLCEYYLTQKYLSCNECPLGRDKRKNCYDEDSTYKRYRFGDTEIRILAAREIKQVAEKALKELTHV